MKGRVLSASGLKIIAIAAMAFDHVGAFLFPSVMWLRYIGRLTFPIMGFFIYEGWRHTRSKRRYALRLLLFAIVSEIPYNLAVSGALWDSGHQNIGFTLLLGLIALELSEKGLWGWVAALAACLMGDILMVDYGGIGALSIMLFGVFGGLGLPPALSVAAGTLALTYGQWQAAFSLIRWNVPGTYGYIPPQFWAVMAIPLLFLYSGKRGKAPGWLFYAFYPGHLLLIYFYGGQIRDLLRPLLT